MSLEIIHILGQQACKRRVAKRKRYFNYFNIVYNSTAFQVIESGLPFLNSYEKVILAELSHSSKWESDSEVALLFLFLSGTTVQ